MLNEHEAHKHHVLTMIENAQRRGRDEREISAIVEQYFGTARAESAKTGLIGRLGQLLKAA